MQRAEFTAIPYLMLFCLLFAENDVCLDRGVHRTLSSFLLLINSFEHVLPALSGVRICFSLNNVDVAGVRYHSGDVVAHQTAGSKNVDGTTLFNCTCNAQLYGVVDTGRCVNVDGFGIYSACDVCYAESSAAVVVKLNNVAFCNALLFSNFGVDAADEVGVTVDNLTVLGDLPQPLGVLLIVSM